MLPYAKIDLRSDTVTRPTPGMLKAMAEAPVGDDVFGDEYIVGQSAHTYKYEGGGAAVPGSIQPQPLANAPDGTIPLDLIAAAIKQALDEIERKGRG